MAIAQTGSTSGLMEILTTPWVDRIIALIAITPNTIELFHRYTSAQLTFVRGVLGIQSIILIITMVLRRTPVRVTLNPFYWLLAFIVSYGIISFISFAPPGVPLAPVYLANTLAVLSALIMIYARLSLGLSIGFVPADRGIMTRGAYRYVRHPIYTGAFIGLLAFVLRAYSPLNLTLAAVLIGLIMLKSLIEERFLRDNPEYAHYMRRVGYRWFPGLL